MPAIEHLELTALADPGRSRLAGGGRLFPNRRCEEQHLQLEHRAPPHLRQVGAGVPRAAGEPACRV